MYKQSSDNNKSSNSSGQYDKQPSTQSEKKPFMAVYLRCSLCGKKTTYYCPGCDRPLCFVRGKRRQKLLNGDDYGQTMFQCKRKHPTDDSQYDSRLYNFTCYHKAHCKSWEKYFSTKIHGSTHST